MTPFEQGQDAFLAGRPVTSNPWPRGPKRMQWNNGWNTEHTKAKVPLEVRDAVSGDRHVTLVFNRSLTDAEVNKIRSLVNEQLCPPN